MDIWAMHVYTHIVYVFVSMCVEYINSGLSSPLPFLFEAWSLSALLVAAYDMPAGSWARLPFHHKSTGF